MNETQLFNFKGQQVRTITINNEPYFVGNDVATILGYSNYRNAVVNHVDKEDKLRTQIEYAGQNRNMTVINESGLYSLNLGVFEVKERTVNNPDGSIRVTITTKVTGKGQQYFINKFLREPIAEL